MSIRRTSIVLVILLLGSCSDIFLGKDPEPGAAQTFESFWHGVDGLWPEFETKRVNWDSIYTAYRPQITDATTDVQLLKIFKDILPVLRDAHTSIYPTKDYHPITYYGAFPRNHFGFSWVRQHYLSSIKGNSSLAYGFVGQDIGYIYIANFSGQDSYYTIIDDILNEFKDVKGIIIDVRSNGGGNTRNGQTIASRFADGIHDYEYVRFRQNPTSKAMSDFYTLTIGPSGPKQFRGKVALLINRYSYSATEDFILAMKTFSQVTVIGDNTGGGSGSRPLQRELPNGWTYRVSSMLVAGADKVPITAGIAPNIRMSITKADSINGVDPIIETAKTTVTH